MKLDFYRQIFEKCSNTIFHENPSSRKRTVPRRPEDINAPKTGGRYRNHFALPLQTALLYKTGLTKTAKRNEVAGEWRKLHNDELNELYSLPTIVGVVKSRMRWAGHVERMGRREGAQGVGGET
jgi:hypothetical protein